MASPARDSDSLLTHAGYVRVLAQRLVFDRELARDVEQETWLAALAHPPRDARAPRAWLAALVRNFAFKAWRGKRRRERREREFARECPSVPTPSEILERESVRREIVEAVLALDEPWRSALVLRYFEELSPREVAQRLGVPLETARTRLKRGLALLRSRLQHGHGMDGAAWALMLVQTWRLEPLSYRAAASAVGKSLIQGAVFMSVAQKTIAAGAVLALIVASIYLYSSGESARPSSAHAAPDTSELRPIEPAVATVEGVEPEPSARAQVESAAPAKPVAEKEIDPRFGSLFLHVVFAEDRSPAGDVGMRLHQYASEDFYKDSLWVRTRIDGSISIDPILAGGVNLVFDRGGQELFHVAAGELTEITLEIPSSVDVGGTVTDARGDPVADAEIYLYSLGGSHEGHVVARTRADGTYAIRAVRPDELLYVSARASMRSPTPQKMLMASAGADLVVDLAFEAEGGAFEGRVISPEGEGITHAAVLVGSEIDHRPWMFADGSRGRAPAAQCVFADETGHFRVEGVAEGEPLVQASAKGFAPWKGSAKIALGRTSALEIALSPGVALRGIVRDAEGAPAAGAEITANGGFEFASAFRLSQKDGSFAFDGLPSGELAFQVDAGDKGRAETKLAGVEGGTLTWNPVLGRGLVLQGRIRAPGRSLDGWWVDAKSASTPPISADVDAEGHFEYPNCSADPMTLSVYTPLGSSFPVAVVENVRPGLDELAIEIDPSQEPSVRMRGRVIDADGGPLAARLSPRCKRFNQSPLEVANAEDGRFEVGPYPPGEWRLRVDMGGFAVFLSAPRDLAANETLDLGDIVLQRGGTIALELRAADGAGLDGAHAMLVDPAGNASWLALRDGRAHSELLAPGTYWLSCGSNDAACAGREVDVSIGEEAHVELVLEAGAPVRVELLRSSGTAPHERVELALFDERGRALLRYVLGPDHPDAMTWTGRLGSGKYRFDAHDEHGGTGSIDIVIDDALATAETEYELRIR